MSAPAAMTSRQRILAALRRQPVDRLPFAPLLDYYTLKDMPPDFPLDITEAARLLGCDLMLRHVPAIQTSLVGIHLQFLGQFAPPVSVGSELTGEHLIETLITPIGKLTGVWGFSDAVGWIPHPLKRAVNDYDEMKVFHYAVDHLSTEPPAPDDDTFLRTDAAIGDDGVATASLGNSPFMYLIEMAWGIESTYYLLHDHREEVEDILAKLHASLRRQAEALAASPAEVVIQYENTSSTLLSPAIFRRYCLPYLNEYADILQGAGKVFLVHMCGKLKAFATDLAQARFDGIADISPAPTGDLPLDEAAAALPGKVLVGGIDATTFVNPDLEAVRAEVAGLIERVKARPGVLLGSADTTPRGTPIETFHLLRQLVETAGAYR